MRRSRTKRLTFAHMLGGAIAFSTVLVVPAVPAAAATTSSFAEGVLTVTGDAADDEVVIRCSNQGRARINRVDPDTGPVDCVDVATIVVSSGEGDDFVDLSPISTAAFTTLTSATIDGGGGNDELEGSEVADTVMGGEGDDSLTLTMDDVFDGGNGTDRGHVFVAGDVTVSETTFPSIETLDLSASDEDDRIDAAAFTGKLFVGGRDGNDVLIGGSGADTLAGGEGDDTLIGGPADDRLYGAAGTDTATGAGGNDRFETSESIDMGPGNDRALVFAVFSGTVDVIGGPGTDRLTSFVLGRLSVADEAIRSDDGRSGLSSIERASFTIFDYDSSRLMIDGSEFTGALELVGGPLADRLIGGSGGDVIDGSWGDDRLVGGGGKDRIDGSRGRDICDGGPGRDRTIDCEDV